MLKEIINKVHVFWTLPLKNKGLFFFNFILCGIACGCVRLFKLQQISPYFGVQVRNVVCSTLLTPKQLHQALLLQRSIRLAVKYTPWNSNCLTQALVARFWCAVLKIPYVLYIGFTKDSNESSGFSSHAWITAGPIAITGELSFPDYSVIASYVPESIEDHFFKKKY